MSDEIDRLRDAVAMREREIAARRREIDDLEFELRIGRADSQLGQDIERILEERGVYNVERDSSDNADVVAALEAALDDRDRLRAALAEAERALRDVSDWCWSSGDGMISGQRAKVWSLIDDALRRTRAALGIADDHE